MDSSDREFYADYFGINIDYLILFKTREISKILSKSKNFDYISS